jgi:hypothetical protein
MTSRTLLTNLINEIAAVTEYTEPEAAVRVTDTVVASNWPDDLKKVYTLQVKYGAQMFKEQVAAMAGLPADTSIAETRELECKSLILNSLFWQLVSLQFPADKQDLVGIRKGWLLVTPAREETPLSDYETSEPSGQVQIN